VNPCKMEEAKSILIEDALFNSTKMNVIFDGCCERGLAGRTQSCAEHLDRSAVSYSKGGRRYFHRSLDESSLVVSIGVELSDM
jgi:hypothetical protein